MPINNQSVIYPNVRNPITSNSAIKSVDPAWYKSMISIKNSLLTLNTDITTNSTNITALQTALTAETTAREAADTALQALAIPPGTLRMVAYTNQDTGWFSCNGQAVSRTTYAALFTAIGTTYGSGDGSTTFNVPNLTGNMPIGYNGTYALGTSGGSATTTLSSGNLPAHTHTYTDSFAQGVSGSFGFAGTANPSFNSSSSNTGSTGSGTAFNTISPYLAINFLIKY